MQARFCLNVGHGLDEMKSDGPREWAGMQYVPPASSLECGVYLGFGECLWRTESGRVTGLDPDKSMQFLGWRG